MICVSIPIWNRIFCIHFFLLQEFIPAFVVTLFPNDCYIQIIVVGEHLDICVAAVDASCETEDNSPHKNGDIRHKPKLILIKS